ncbi:MAG: hypothetical protein WAN05_06735 [Roseiarcus sp.]
MGGQGGRPCGGDIPDCVLMQPSARIIPAQTKEKEIRRKQNSFLLVSFAFFYFLESGLFKGLQPKKLKKISRLPASRDRLWDGRPSHAFFACSSRPDPSALTAISES